MSHTTPLRVRPLTLKQANAVTSALHRHHKPAHGHRWSLGAYAGEVIVGVATVGRPTARLTEQYTVAEVTRLTTDGTKNACSFLYSACARVAKEMGYASIQTFVLEAETGVSLKAAGWTRGNRSRGGTRNRPSRAGRREDQPMGPKVRWFKELR